MKNKQKITNNLINGNILVFPIKVDLLKQDK